MSSYIAAAYHPKLKLVTAAWFMDDYFGRHDYGVQFDGDEHVYTPLEVVIPIDTVFLPVGDVMP